MRTTYRRLYDRCREILAEAGVPEPGSDAWLLLEECFGLERSRYFLDRDMEQEMDDDAVKREALERFWTLTEKRRQRIPVQQLLGHVEFMGLPFLVDGSVLIPRADTETLVETVLEDRKKKHGGRLLDMCTGSGCIAVALSVLGDFEETDAADLSVQALRLAEINAQRNRADIRFFDGDLFEKIEGQYDVIVSNPPYIAAPVIETLEPEVREHEPRTALNGGADGLDFYRRIAAQAGRYLKPGGSLYLEIGYDQAAAVSTLLSAHGFCEIHIRRDLAGCDRVAAASWRRN